jgi:hypothetical protein
MSLCAAALLACTSAVMGQSLERADIRGVVYDPDRAVVPGAALVLSNSETGFRRESKSDSAGEFRFVQVRPGRYRLTIEAPGFAATKLENVELHVGDDVSISVDLRFATRSEEVTVTASGLIADTNTAGVSELITGKSVSSLPLPGRDYRDLAQLSPSAQVATGLRGGIRLGGQQSDYTGLSIDGADATNNFYGENFGSIETNNFTIPLESVDEFRVVTNGFAPEFGRSTGGLINVVTKSGSDELHGSGHYLFRNRSLTASDALGFRPNIDLLQQFGGAIGFPIVKEKQFLFLAVDTQREHGPLITRFARNVDGLPALPPPYNFTLASLEGPHTQFQNLFSVLGHYDWQVDNNNHFSTRIFFSRNDTDGFTGGEGQNETVLAFDNTEHFQNQGPNAVLSLNTVIGPHKVNELKLLVAYETRKRHANSDLPQILINDTGSIGRRYYLPSNGDNGKLQVEDNFDYLAGRHDIKFGGDVDSFLDNKDMFAAWSKGEYLYNTLEDFEAGNPYSFIQGFGLNGQTLFKAGTLQPNYQTSVGLYWQDKWQVTPRLTVTYGLRWDGTANPQPQSRIPGQQVYVGVGPIGPHGSHLAPVPQNVPNDWEQWGPRAGFSYALGPAERATMIRGAWGYYYGTTPLIFFPTSGGSRLATLFCSPGPGNDCLPPGGFPNLFPGTLPISVDQMCSYAPLPLGCPSISYVDPAFRNPRVSNLTFGVDRGLGKGWQVSATYAYVHSSRLRTGGFFTTQWARNVVVDHYDQFGRAIVVPYTGIDSTIAPVGFGTSELASFSRANYHELVLGVRKNVSRLQLFGNYTLSNNQDNTATERDSDSYFGPQDPFNINLDYGRSGIDIRHQFKSGFVLSLPYKFTLSDSMIVHSGLAYPAYDTVDANQDSVVNQFSFNYRPVITPANGKAYLLARFPNRQPGYFETAIRVSRSFKISERMAIEAVADIFNLTNHGNLFSNPDVSGFVPDQLASPPRAGQQYLLPGMVNGAPTGAPAVSRYRVLDQISPGSSPFAAQFGIYFRF